MIQSLNPVGNYYSPCVQGKTISSDNENIQSSKKSTFSTEQKVLLGLGALAAVAIGGLLVKKRLDNNIIKEADRLLQKTEDFSLASFKEVCLGWKNSGKFNKDAGDKIFLFKKSALTGGDWDTYHNKLHNAMNMSDNGFAIVLKPNDESRKCLVKYFDPKSVSCEYVQKAMNAEGSVHEFRFID